MKNKKTNSYLVAEKLISIINRHSITELGKMLHTTQLRQGRKTKSSRKEK